jgi:hypothetical protein
MPLQRSRSDEREKRQRQRSRWSKDKKEDIKAKDRIRKREIASHADVGTIFKEGEDGIEVAEPRNLRKEDLESKTKSQYEMIRLNNIKERLEGMMRSGLWSKEEVALLRKRYMLERN